MTESAMVEPSSPELDAHATRSTPKWLLALAVAVIALVAGAVGATLSHLAFPAEAGPPGQTGSTGPTGPAGAPGVDGASSTLDTNKVGYCFNYSTQYRGSDTWVDSVELFAPTSNNGTLSCPVGNFVSLTPTGPNGTPIKGYDASKQQ